MRLITKRNRLAEFILNRLNHQAYAIVSQYDVDIAVMSAAIRDDWSGLMMLLSDDALSIIAGEELKSNVIEFKSKQSD